MPISMILGKQIKFSSTLAKRRKRKGLKKKKIYGQSKDLQVDPLLGPTPTCS